MWDEKLEESWEERLRKEWLGVIAEELDSNKGKVYDVISARDLEENKWITFDIDEEFSCINMYTSNLELIWYIKPWNYTYWRVSSNNHLEKKVFEEFRWKWYAQALYDLYKEKFNIPEEEYTHKASVINFLLKNGYTLVSKIDLDWSEIELTPNDISIILEELSDSIKNWDNDLNYIYRLSF